MQNQPYPRNFLNPTASSFTSRVRTASSTATPNAGVQSRLPHEDAWTPYDGLGPVGQQPRNPRLEGNWRSGSRGNSGGSGGRGGSSGGGSRGNQQRGEPASKRPKQMPQSQGGGRNARGGQAGRGGGRFTNAGRLDNELIDEGYLSRNYEPLKKEDYPNASTTLFTNPKVFLWDNKSSVAKSSFASMRGGVFQCTIFLKMPDGSRFEAVGESQNKKVAEKIAAQHAILKLHKMGQLKELVYGGIHHGAFDQDLLNEEQEAKMDIYDYCARYDTIPIFINSDSPRPGSRKAIIEVTIEMPEQGIKATARATDRRVADILASVEFKRQAEEWHAKHSDEDILVKDVANVLNSRNAKKFFEFYKIHNPSCVYVCETKPMKGGSRRLNASMTIGQVYLNNEPVGEHVEMGGKKSAETAAWVTAAVALKDQNPELFPQFVEALRLGNGEILKPIQPTWLTLDSDAIISMTDTLLSIRRIGLPLSEEEMALEDGRLQQERERRRFHKNKLDPALAKVKSKVMLEAYENYLKDEKLEMLRQKRLELPMVRYTDQVLELVNNNEVSIIVGATGSGKTTQVPQILLEAAIKAGNGADCNVICTQPRRIAATSVAQRVAVERNEPLQKSVGYHVRFDAKLPLPGGSITYCTTGILLQQLRHNAEEVLDGITHLVIDEVHERDIMIDYLLIILKRIMKNRRLKGKAGLKVVLMSATMDTELFSGYFGYKEDGKFSGCPHLSVPGRTFPVKEFYLEDIRNMLKAYPNHQLGLLREDDTKQYLAVEENFKPLALPSSMPASAAPSRNPSRVPSRAVSPKAEFEDGDDTGDATINWKQEVNIRADGQAAASTEKEDAIVPNGLVATVLAHISQTTTDGAILAFLPGLDEILKVDDMLRNMRPLSVDFNNKDNYKIYMLHSSIPNQNEVFEDVPDGVRKIILSTNIAETSITIPDVKYVVDTGKLREKQYEQARRITQLVCTWVSKSNSKQRAGRAGRVQDGNYFALFPRPRFDSFRGTGLPEMLRSDLQEICLDIKLQGFRDPIAQFLSEAIEPPAPHAIQASLRQLLALGAIDPDENLTQLGHVLATMPVEPALGKMILLAVIFRCLDPILILGASAGGRDIFVSPPERRDESRRARARFVGNTGSDHMGVINAFTQWRTIRDRDGMGAAHGFAEQNFLHRGALKVLEQTAKQVQDILGEIGIIPRTRRDERNGSEFGHPSLNANSNCVPLIKALTLAGMYPNLAVCAGGRGFRTVSENFTMIHPSSSHYTPRDDRSVPLGTIITYSTKAKSSDGTSIMLRQNTESTALAALLFGGKLRWYGNTLEIDSWLPFRARGEQAKITIEFKKCLDRLLAHAFRTLSKRGSSSGYLADDPARETLSQGIVEVLENDAGIKRERARGGVDNWRPSSRNDTRFPPLGTSASAISRPNSRNDNRFPPLGAPNSERFSNISRPESRTDNRFPPLGVPSSDRFGGASRPESRTDNRFPPLGVPNSDRFGSPSRPESRTDNRFPPLGAPNSDRFGGASRPESRTDNRFPPLGAPSSDRFGGASRPESRTDNRFPPFGAPSSDRFGGASRPESRTDNKWGANSRPESRTDERLGGRDDRFLGGHASRSPSRTAGERWVPGGSRQDSGPRFGAADVRSSLPAGNGFGPSTAPGGADRYRPGPGIQGRWR